MSKNVNINSNDGREYPDVPGIQHNITYELPNGVRGQFIQRGLDRQQLKRGTFTAPRTGYMRIATDLNWVFLGLLAKVVSLLQTVPTIGAILAIAMVIAEVVLILSLIVWTLKNPLERGGRAVEILVCIFIGLVAGYYTL